MDFIQPHLPRITDDVSFIFDAEEPHPRITHDIEFDITLETFDYTRRESTLPTIARQLTRMLSAGAEMGIGVAEALIRKPPGEPGRPESGGFNLFDQLKWNEDDYERFKVCCFLV
jgi:hypothetical protein